LNIACNPLAMVAQQGAAPDGKKPPPVSLVGYNYME